MQIVTETEAETEAAPGVMQGDLWSRCLADAASKRRGGQSLGRETTGREVKVLQENRRHTEMQDADAETQAD